MSETNHKKIYFALLTAAVLLTLSVVFGLQKNTAKGQEGGENLDIVCNKEIPIGEALEEAAKFTGGVRDTVFSAETSAEEEITAAQSLISAVQSCNPNNCHPSCVLVPHTCYAPGGPNQGPIPYSCPVCNSHACTGQICPVGSINSAYNNVSAAYDKILSAQQSGQDLIESQNSSWKYNNTTYQNQTQVEIIQNKLTVAREEFNKCFLSETEWQEYIDGKKVGKQLVSCEDSADMGRDLTQECNDACQADINSDKCKECTGCKSPGNFFCCDVK